MESMKGKGGIVSAQQHDLGSGTWLNLGVSEGLLVGGKRGGLMLVQFALQVSRNHKVSGTS